MSLSELVDLERSRNPDFLHISELKELVEPVINAQAKELLGDDALDKVFELLLRASVQESLDRTGLLESAKHITGISSMDKAEMLLSLGLESKILEVEEHSAELKFSDPRIQEKFHKLYAYSIGKLPLADYSVGDYEESGRVVYRLPNHKASISPINILDLEDMRRLQAADHSEQAQHFQGAAQINDVELASMAAGHTGRFVFAVRGVKEHVGETEIGELQGMLQFEAPQDVSVFLDQPKATPADILNQDLSMLSGFYGEKARADGGWLDVMLVDRSKVLESLSDLVDSGKIWELSYLKVPSVAAHQLSDGVAEGCVLFNSMQLTGAGDYVNFSKMTDCGLVASVDPENRASIGVLVSAGFIYVGRARYEEDSEAEDLVFVLDWERLRTRTANKVFKFE